MRLEGSQLSNKEGGDFRERTVKCQKLTPSRMRSLVLLRSEAKVAEKEVSNSFFLHLATTTRTLYGDGKWLVCARIKYAHEAVD